MHPPRLIVGVCTYRRNEQLVRLLEGLLVAVEAAAGRCTVGVAIIDDTAAGEARQTVGPYADRFELGLHYRVSGKQNISIARNMALAVGLEHGDLLATTDDDCVPDPQWIVQLLHVFERDGVDAVTGPQLRVAPEHCPAWVTDQPFLAEGVALFDDGAPMAVASTHNSMISTRWLADHATARFDPALGVLGGEDMVFSKHAHQLGMRISYARHAVVYEHQPRDRCTLGYLARNAWWLGNSQYVTSITAGDAGRGRLVVHGCAEACRAIARPFRRIARREPPQWRFAFTSVLRAMGILAGAVGRRVSHH